MIYLLNEQKKCLFQEKGNACLAILDGSEAELGDLNVFGGEKTKQNEKLKFDTRKRRMSLLSVKIMSVFIFSFAEASMQDILMIHDNDREATYGLGL